jgi:four helix bundle protein
LTRAVSGAWQDQYNPEVTMRDTRPTTEFQAHGKAVRAAAIAISLVMRVPAPLRPIADQIIRSASSVPANLAEGAGRSGRDRLHHWRIAYASAKEVDTHLRLLLGTGAVSSERARTARRLFDDVRAMTWRLLHPAD